MVKPVGGKYLMLGDSTVRECWSREIKYEGRVFSGN